MKQQNEERIESKISAYEFEDDNKQYSEWVGILLVIAVVLMALALIKTEPALNRKLNMVPYLLK
jgi:hypothetical protein